MNESRYDLAHLGFRKLNLVYIYQNGILYSLIISRKHLIYFDFNRYL